jgi:hypothetical protein
MRGLRPHRLSQPLGVDVVVGSEALDAPQEELQIRGERALVARLHLA